MPSSANAVDWDLPMPELEYCVIPPGPGGIRYPPCCLAFTNAAIEVVTDEGAGAGVLLASTGRLTVMTGAAGFGASPEG